jgi:hypothetical protein
MTDLCSIPDVHGSQAATSPRGAMAAGTPPTSAARPAVRTGATVPAFVDASDGPDWGERWRAQPDASADARRITVVYCDAGRIAGPLRVARVAPHSAHWIVRFGDREPPDLPRALRQAVHEGRFDIDESRLVYVIERPMVSLGEGRGGMARWRRALFAWLHARSWAEPQVLNLPAARTRVLRTPVSI